MAPRPPRLRSHFPTSFGTRYCPSPRSRWDTCPTSFSWRGQDWKEALGEGYVALARSHGARPFRVLLRQAAPVAALPLVNQFAMSFGGLLGGTVIVETVFAYPGLGSLLYEGILALDFPLVQGVFLLLVFSMVLANIAADFTQSRLDPRWRDGLETGR